MRPSMRKLGLLLLTLPAAWASYTTSANGSITVSFTNNADPLLRNPANTPTSDYDSNGWYMMTQSSATAIGGAGGVGIPDNGLYSAEFAGFGGSRSCFERHS